MNICFVIKTLTMQITGSVAELPKTTTETILKTGEAFFDTDKNILYFPWENKICFEQGTIIDETIHTGLIVGEVFNGLPDGCIVINNQHKKVMFKGRMMISLRRALYVPQSDTKPKQATDLK